MTPDGMKSIDSLSAHEFQVAINGTTLEGIFSVQGLTSYTESAEVPPLTITKMVQRDPDSPFNAWARETRGGKRPTRELSVIAMDEGTESRRWVYKDAYITEISFSDFDTARSELVAERIEIRAAVVEEVWP